MESVVVGEPGMSEGRRGLGRGLSALLGEVDSAPAQAPGDTSGGSREAPIEILIRAIPISRAGPSARMTW
jgi:ParB family chromosome partitioning protein